MPECAPEDSGRRLEWEASRLAHNLIVLKLWLKHPDADRPRIMQDIANSEAELDRIIEKRRMIP